MRLKKIVNLIPLVMTRAQFSEAVKIAGDLDISLSDVDDSVMFGCGLADFKPVYVTLRQVAKIVRWQAMQFNGEWDAEELDNMARIAQNKFLII